ARPISRGGHCSGLPASPGWPPWSSSSARWSSARGRSLPSPPPPPRSSPTTYLSPDTPAAEFRSVVLTVGLIAFLWFVVALTTLLRRVEGEPPWRSTIAMVSGILLPALALSGNEVAAGFRADDLDPQIARYAFDEAHV